MNRATPACRIVVMAKAPLPGYAKTRLIPSLGVDGAAALARRLLAHAVANALRAGLGPVQLHCAPGAGAAGFEPFAGLDRLTLCDQLTGDLGARMRGAFESALAGADGSGGGALLIGTDTPALDACVLREAADALLVHDAVFVPTHDGGYALVGLRRPAPALFEGMTWSTPRVMADTRARLAGSGLTHAELATQHDIDEPADLIHLPSGWIT